MNFSVVTADSGHVALGLAIRRLNVSGTFMQSAAHPDDEHNALFAMFTLGKGLRSADVQTNRGEGGQNEIGPELFRDIGVLRTSELMSAHRIDGAEQYFTRAIDYGYSFSPEEVIDKWGKDETVGDFVRLIRTLRPEVVLTMNIQGGGGDRAHEATTILAREAYQRSRRSLALSGTDQGGPQALAAEEAVLLRVRRRRRPRRSGRAPAPASRADQHRRVRRAARPHVCRDRHRRAQQSQMSGHRQRPARASRHRRARRSPVSPSAIS